MAERRSEHRRRDIPAPDSTGRRILVLICRGRRTVAQLAEDVRLTGNAVRAQLQRLERDGLIQRSGFDQGVRRPHVRYELTAAARARFPKAYSRVLKTLIDILHERLPAKARRDLFRLVADRLLGPHLKPSRGRLTAHQRLAAFVSGLNGSSLGVELERDAGKTIVRACNCPLASVTVDHPEVCELVAQVAADALGTRVRERCERGDATRCCFEVGP